MTSDFSSKNLDERQEKDNIVTNINVELVRVMPFNIHVHPMQQQCMLGILPALEQYGHELLDGISPEDDYDEWYMKIFDIIKDISPWFFAVHQNGEPTGAIWANLESNYSQEQYSAQIGGISKRKASPEGNRLAYKQLVKMVFEKTPVYIIRSEYHEKNKAVDWLLRGVGMGHPEPRRAYRMLNGEPLTGIIRSMTREEFEQNELW